MSGAHDGPKIGCDTGCILGPAWVPPTALQPAARGPVASNAVPSVISIYPTMRWSHGGLCKRAVLHDAVRGKCRLARVTTRRQNRAHSPHPLRRLGAWPTEADLLRESPWKQGATENATGQARRGTASANADAGVGPQKFELAASLREGTDVVVLACLSVQRALL